MTLARRETVAVYADVDHFDEPILMDPCVARRLGPETSSRSNMTPGGCGKPEAFTFDPDLALVHGPQYPVPDRASFGVFLDSSPIDGDAHSCKGERTCARAERDAGQGR